MGDLREQMLKAGLISKKQARKAAHSERVADKQADPEARQQQARDARDEVRREQQAQQQRDRQLATARKADEHRRQEEQQQRQRREAAWRKALQEGVLPNWAGKRTYYFQDGTSVDALSVSDEAARRLELGEAAIVRDPDPRSRFQLITSGAAARLAEVAPEAIVRWHRR